MRRLLLHPGFHKTGTSSAQHFLWHNRPRLNSHVAIFQLRHLSAVAKSCMSYSKGGDPLALIDLAAELDAVFEGLPKRPTRHILLTCEGLSGHLPGWPGVEDYRAALVTLPYITGYLADRFPAHRTEVVLTTREPQPWLISAYRHHLMSHRLTEEESAFVERLKEAGALDRMVSDIAAALAPLTVSRLPLERAAQDALGPGGALLRHLPLPEEVWARLEPVGHGNRGPTAQLAVDLLTLNRSGLPEEELVRRKAELAEQAGVGGWAR